MLKETNEVKESNKPQTTILVKVHSLFNIKCRLIALHVPECLTLISVLTYQSVQIDRLICHWSIF